MHQEESVMRLALGGLLAAVVGTAALGQTGDIPRRFGVPADLQGFPQATARDALSSVVKAIDRRRVAYLLAHLADPAFVDERVQLNGGDFDRLVEETTAKLTEDAAGVKQLQRLLAEGDWQDTGATATVSHKDIASRRVFLKRIGGRWFLENRVK
jgi:hypothetical protein